MGDYPSELLYNPTTRCLEWVDVPIGPDEGTAADNDADDKGDADDRAGKEGQAESPSKKSNRNKRSGRRTEGPKTTADPPPEGNGKSADRTPTSGEPRPRAQQNPDSSNASNRNGKPAAPGGSTDEGKAADHESHDDESEDQDENDEAAVRRMFSKYLSLSVRQPGQLRNQTYLDGEVEVEVQDELLSGIEARLFDARGRRQPKNVLTPRTRLRLNFRVFLEDEFNRRDMTATHSIHFDEVIPDDQRIDDILAALRDRGFDVEKLPMESTRDSPRWLISAERTEGPDNIRLGLVVHGRRYTTRRRAETPGWHRYTSKFDSGDMRISVVGEVRGTSHELTREVNELRQSLSARFRHVQAQR